MTDTHDTIDGLLAEFRGYAAGMPPSYHVTMSWHDFRRMLDRFDAAHKREAVTGSNQLREALKHIKDRLPHMLQYMRVHWEDASAGGYFDELMLVIDAALAAPATAEKSSAVGDAAKLRKALVAIKALTEPHAHEHSELGTVYRTAKAFLKGVGDGD